MNDNLLGVISSKALEKQLKIVNSRLEEIQSEVAELEKIKEACLTLMGSPSPEQLEEGLSQKSQAPKRKKEKGNLKPAGLEKGSEDSSALPVDADSADNPPTVTH
ncbi:MAG: hypothetical protein R3B54_10010 [Bdellovibrionota bacterium]